MPALAFDQPATEGLSKKLSRDDVPKHEVHQGMARWVPLGLNIGFLAGIPRITAWLSASPSDCDLTTLMDFRGFADN